MPAFVSDPKTKRMVILAPNRVNRPHDNASFPTDTSFREQKPARCPFCPGSEPLNKELFRIGGEDGDPNWRIRVIENKFPLTSYHEVIIHSPLHDQGIVELPQSQVALILEVYKARYQYHMSQNHGRVIVFNNHDVHAGASIKHPHSQLVVVPFDVPVEDEPMEPIVNIVKETKHFTLYCPTFSQWPYEIWIAPRKEGGGGERFGDISEEALVDLSKLLQGTLKHIVAKFSEEGAMKQPGSDKDVPFNYYIYHGPQWYLRIVPRLVHRAGFELGSGISVNITDPAEAAKEYKEALASSL